MSPRLLLDENLSERLLPLLIQTFPESTHVRSVGLGGASDRAIWEWTRQRELVLVTKDEDFLGLSVALGAPPKVVCLAIGNASNATTATLLLQRSEEIEQFCLHQEAGFLLLGSAAFSP
jgi:predicted nuclease of predicted toxin-antitoxin system